MRDELMFSNFELELALNSRKNIVNCCLENNCVIALLLFHVARGSIRRSE